MKKPLFKLILLVLPAFFLACDNVNEPLNPDEFPEGEIWATIARDTFFRFDSPGALRPQDANGYVAANRFTNITRESTQDFYGVAQLRLLRVDLDELTYPVTLTNEFSFTFRPEPNTAFTGRDGEVQVTLTRFEDNVLEGTFSGLTRNEDFPSQTYQVTDGQFKIRLTRF